MVKIEETVGFLQRVPLFHGLNKRQLERLAKSFVERKYPAGKAIVAQGEGGVGFFIVVSGQAEAVREISDGTKVVVNTFGPKDFFGELALLDEGIRTASVITKEDTTCLALTSWDFTAKLKEDAEMAIVILQELARRFRVALDTL